MPLARFDTDYVEVRRVHNVLPFVSIDANRYSVPPDALGHKVEIRRGVDDSERWCRFVRVAFLRHTFELFDRVPIRRWFDGLAVPMHPPLNPPFAPLPLQLMSAGGIVEL